MGAGASASVPNSYPDTEAAALAAGYTAEQVESACAWVDEYGVWATVAISDIPKMMEIALPEAEDQVNNEPRAPRFALLGTPTVTAAAPFAAAAASVTAPPLPPW